MTANESQLPEWVRNAIADLPPLVSKEQTAKFFDVGIRSISRWIRIKRLKSLKTSMSGSGRVLIPRLEIARLLMRMANGH